MSLIANGAGESAASNFYSGAVSSSIRMQNARLTETPGATGNDKKWTFSAWIKRGNLGASYIFAGTPHGGYNGIAAIYFNAADQLHTYYDTSGANPYGAVGPRLYRDTSSWYHLVWAVDAANTVHKIWINNELVSTDTGKYPPNYNYGINRSGSEMVIGDGSWDSYGSTDFNGYMAEINHCDGQYLEPDSFGETKNGVWIPLKDPSLTYGTNGFRLQFLQTGTSANSSGIGADTSGQANHFAVTALAASDVVPDSPENNFCTLNSVGRRYGHSYSGTFSEGNLKFASSGNSSMAFGTMAINEIASQGGVYFEIRLDSQDVSRTYVGVIGDNGVNNKNSGSNNASYSLPIKGLLRPSAPDGSMAAYFGTSTSASMNLSSHNSNYSNGDVVGVAILSDGKTFFHKNGTYLDDSSGNVGNPSTGANPLGTLDLTLGDWVAHVGYNSTFSINFGQDGTFSGQETSGGNQDGNGIGDFMFAVPTNCFAICSSNMAEPTIGPNSDTQADDYFNTVLYTGNGGTGHAISGVGFQPDWTWIKGRSDADYNYLVDSSRGYTERLFSNLTDGASVEANTVTQADSDGFTLGSDAGVNRNNSTYVAWNWKANGGTTSSNSSGSITSTVQANVAAGFSIILYAGNSTKGATIGHGLSAAPEMIWFKRRNASAGWAVYNKDLTDNGYALLLNSTAAQDNRNTQFLNETSPSSTLITLGDWNEANAGSNYVAYAFHSVEGYSKIGSYIGNGSTDGTFVYTGFRPAFLMYKRTDSTGNWLIDDNKTQTFNPDSNYLLADTSDAEGDTTTNTAGHVFDMLSNGFKMRNTNSARNASGGTFIYMAFAEAPFKYANAR